MGKLYENVAAHEDIINGLCDWLDVRVVRLDDSPGARTTNKAPYCSPRFTVTYVPPANCEISRLKFSLNLLILVHFL